MNHLWKIPIITAAWLLCCKITAGQPAPQPLSGINPQLCVSFGDNTASIVCESSIMACRHIVIPDVLLPNTAGQHISGQDPSDQTPLGQDTAGQEDVAKQNTVDLDISGQDASEQDISGQETVYIMDSRYLVQYSGGYDDRLGIYDLNTLQDGAFGDYIIRSYQSFRFTTPMKDLFLKTVLNDASFQGEPYFTYYDADGQLRLELYAGENGAGCGVCYDKIEAGMETPKNQSGFAFAEYRETAWETSEYLTRFQEAEYYKDVPLIQSDDCFRNYKESYEYNNAGQVTAYSCEAETNLFSDEWTPVTIAGYRCIYREDGTVQEKDQFRNPLIFSTSDSSVHLDYDRTGRIVYIRSYITHGFLEYYYIYEDHGNIPACGVTIDHYPDLLDGILIKYS